MATTWLCVLAACSPRPPEPRPAPSPSALESECAQGSHEACAQLGAALAERPATAERARELLGAACDRGARVGCTALGELHLPTDPERGEVLLELACAAWESRACLLLGRRYDGDRALEYLERACLADELDGCVALADALGVDVARAASLYAFACDRGAAAACVGQARLVIHGGLAANEAVSARVRANCKHSGTACVAHAAALIADAADGSRVATALAAGCSLGEPLACAHHGLVLYYGWGVPKARKPALAQLRAACDLGLESACHGFSVPDLLEAGCVEPSECSAAVEAWEGTGDRALGALWTVVSRGLLRACGDACLQPPDADGAELPRAQSWYRHACNHTGDDCARVDFDQARVVAEVRCSGGSLAHCVALANQLPDPDPGAEDDAALSLLEHACDLDHGQSCARLGLWFTGPGSEHDHGVNLLRRACELEAAGGCAGLEQLDLSP